MSTQALSAPISSLSLLLVSAPISSLSLLLVQTQAARWKAAASGQLTGAHLYLDIAKSGYLLHGYSSGMLNILTIFTKFFIYMECAQMQHIYNFERNLSISPLSFLRLNVNVHS